MIAFLSLHAIKIKVRKKMKSVSLKLQAINNHGN